tara:strand:- start:5249 stop:6196 length:948 start_codon:yes stop_codon:yes gene_type:complete
LIKYFITGGSGFLGASLVRRLVEEGNKVKIFDNLIRGNLKKLTGIENKIEICQGDVREKKKLLKESRGYEVFVHLAAINGTKFFYSKPQEVLDVSIRGILNAVDVAKENNIKKFIFSSSSEVYQTPKIIPTKENAELTVPDVFNPRYSYGGGKIISELVCLNYYKDFFEKMLIFRPHNVFGPDMGFEHVIPEFILKANEIIKNKKKKFTLKGNGRQQRSFIYINDFTNALIKVIKKGKDKNIYHIGNSKEISVMKLAKVILKLMKIDVEVNTSSAPAGETIRRCPDNSKIKKLGYKQLYSLEDGLRETISWYKSN